MSWAEQVLQDLEKAAKESGAKSPRAYLMSLDERSRHAEVKRLGAMLFGASGEDFVMIDERGRVYIVKDKLLLANNKIA